MRQTKNVAFLKGLNKTRADLATEVADSIFTSAKSELGSSLSNLLRSGNMASIVSASDEFIPMNYTNADTFSRDYLCAEMMSKFPHWDLGIDRSAVALSKFEQSELALSQMDLKFLRHVEVGCDNNRATLAAIISMVARRIDYILGDFDPQEWSNSCTFGPGASTSIPRRKSELSNKFGAKEPHCTYNCEPLAELLISSVPKWLATTKVIEGSRLVTVPKNAKTDRTICIEPDLNMYCQKGIGEMIRRRLQRKCRTLLADAQLENQRRAAEGSLTGDLATIDLSAASDSIHMDLVRELLPPSWVTVIEQARSPWCVLPSGEKILLRKVASMGNGFTFELETLIFKAFSDVLSRLFAGGHPTYVFGDDIIVHKGAALPLIQVLGLVGFRTNVKKTFIAGSFRESCGKHYFSGSDVTPFYIRDKVDNLSRYFWLANSIRRYARLEWGLDSRWLSSYELVKSKIPACYQFSIPEGYGDGGLVEDWDERPRQRAKNWFEGTKYRSVGDRVQNRSLDGHGTLLKVLHLMERSGRFWDQTVDYRDGSANPDVMRSEWPRVVGKCVGTSIAPQWPSYGPWL